jgi:hypothetical protein
MDSRLVRFPTLALLAFVFTACNDSTAPSLNEVLANRARWSNQHLTDYTYHYQVTGFFISWAGQEIGLEVHNGIVTSATFLSTGQPVPGSPTDLPTIDALFDRAALAARDHKLTGITFDPVLHYPVRMDLSGPPDASGSVFAAALTRGGATS